MTEVELLGAEIENLEGLLETCKQRLRDRNEELTELKKQSRFIMDDSRENADKADRYWLMYKQTLRELEETQKQLEKSEELRIKMREACQKTD